MRNSRWLCLITVFTAVAGSISVEADQPEQKVVPECCCLTKGDTSLAVSEANYSVPDVMLNSSNGQRVHARTVINNDEPVLLQFAFTTCSTVCPVLSSTTAKAQHDLGNDAKRFRIITISIDPQHDTPAVMRDYAESLKAGPNWHFLTGEVDAVAELRKSFDAFTPNKSRHEALTFISGSTDGKWTRFTGFISAQRLTAEMKKRLAVPTPNTSTIEREPAETSSTNE